MEVVSFVNCKGGVGKTTLTACFAQALALVGYRVLAIDNDGQYNLTLALGATGPGTTIRDIYRASLGEAPRVLHKAIRSTAVEGLSVISSPKELCYADVRDPAHLQKCFRFCRLADSFDFVLIDNPPGLDRLQEASIHASDMIVVPTELSHFAINGIWELHQLLNRTFPEKSGLVRIVPNLVRGGVRAARYMAELKKMFPDRITAESIPFEPTLESTMRDEKALFLRRSQERLSTMFLSLLGTLFGLDDERIRTALEQRKLAIVNKEGRERFFRTRPLEARLFDDRSGVWISPAELNMPRVGGSQIELPLMQFM